MIHKLTYVQYRGWFCSCIRSRCGTWTVQTDQLITLHSMVSLSFFENRWYPQELMTHWRTIVSHSFQWYPQWFPIVSHQTLALLWLRRRVDGVTASSASLPVPGSSSGGLRKKKSRSLKSPVGEMRALVAEWGEGSRNGTVLRSFWETCKKLLSRQEAPNSV